MLVTSCTQQKTSPPANNSNDSTAILNVPTDTVYSLDRWYEENYFVEYSGKDEACKKKVIYKNDTIVLSYAALYDTVNSPTNYSYAKREIYFNGEPLNIEKKFLQKFGKSLTPDMTFAAKDVIFYKYKNYYRFYMVLYSSWCDGDLCYDVLLIKIDVYSDGNVEIGFEEKYMPEIRI